MDKHLVIPLTPEKRLYDINTDEFKTGRRALFFGWKTEFGVFRLRTGMTSWFKRENAQHSG